MPFSTIIRSPTI